MADFEEYQDDEQIYEERGWLPSWWTFMLWAGIAFAPIYGIYMHGIAGWSQASQYEEEVTLYQELHPEQAEIGLEDGVNPLRDDEDSITAGKQVYASNCAACHGTEGLGQIGPNLMDNEWLHGSTDEQVYASIMEGISAENVKQNPPKGIMPAHDKLIGSRKVLQVMSYLSEKNSSITKK